MIENLRLKFRGNWVRREIFGRQLILHHGTFRDESDYDDDWFVACALHSETFFDVGAHTGLYSIFAALLPNIKEVVLVEANPKALKIAAENLIRNQLSTKARFIAAFAGDTMDSTVKLWTVGIGSAGSIFQKHAASASKAGTYLEVSTVTLDHLMNYYNRVPDLVNIDVEGAEYQVLLGSVNIAAHTKTRFLVEMHSNPDLPMRENAAKVLEWCKDTAYRAWYLKEKSLLEDPVQIEHRGRCHLLVQPAEWSFPDWLLELAQGSSISPLLIDTIKESLPV